MQNRRSISGKIIIAIVLIGLLWTTSVVAGQLTLAWDPNPGECDGTSLIGYNLYYKAGSSVAADPGGADLIYIPLGDPEFDPDNPSFQVTGLSNSAQYYFVVTAMYGDEESTMSNEVSAFSSTGGGQSRSINAADDGSSAGSSGGGCFISALQ